MDSTLSARDHSDATRERAPDVVAGEIAIARTDV